jgi:hypothetical protein
MKEKGVPIDFIDPNPEVRKNAELAPDWPYREQAQYLYPMAELIRGRLIDPIARIDRNQMPDPVLSFDNLRNKRSLAAYRLTRNPQGLNYEIIINSQHYEEVDGKMKWKFGEWALLETLTHELVHEWQQTVGKDPVQVGKVYHNKEFVDKCENIGLHPKLGEGYHLKVADGPFEILMNELGIEKPPVLDIDLDDIDWFKWFFKDKERKGRSTLKKWDCPNCGLKVRIGISGDPMLRHHTCEKPDGLPVFLVPGDVYDAKK